MKTTLREGQEWEKSAGQWNKTRLRVMSSPGTRRRVKVGTVTPDGRVIREREILVSALSNTPKGYQLVKDVGEADKALEVPSQGMGVGGMAAVIASEEAEFRRRSSSLDCCGGNDENPPAHTQDCAVHPAVDNENVPSNPSPLARVREALEALRWRADRPGGERSEDIADRGIAALAPLERALPVLLDTYHAQHSTVGARLWQECPECSALLEGT